MSEDRTQKLPEPSNGKLDELFQLILAIRGEVAGLKQTFDARLRDTQPLRETLELMRADIRELHTGQAELQAGLQGEIAELQAGQQQLQTGQIELQTRLSELQTVQKQLQTGLGELQQTQEKMRAEMRNLNRHFSVLNDTFIEFKADYKDLDKRVYQLELKDES